MPASDTGGFLPAVRHLISPTGLAVSDSTAFGSSAEESQMDQINSELNGSESPMDNLDGKTIGGWFHRLSRHNNGTTLEHITVIISMIGKIQVIFRCYKNIRTNIYAYIIKFILK